MNAHRNTGFSLLPVLFAITFALLTGGSIRGSAQTKTERTKQAQSAQKPSRSSPAVQKPDDRLIVNADLISLNVAVTDNYGRFISGLDKSAFRIFDDNEPQEIEFFSDDDVPVSLAIVVDYSGSMGGGAIANSELALSRFMLTSHERDEYFVIGFNDRPQLLLEKTRDSQKVLDTMANVRTKGPTALFDALYLGIGKVQHAMHQKKAVLIISDGGENNSRYSFGQLQQLLKESDVIVYSVLIQGADALAGGPILQRVSSISGGKRFVAGGAAEMDDIFQRIALELRHQYSIGFRPTNFAANGKWHKLKIKVTPPRGIPRVSVRSREGYLAIPTTK
jgi:Ca-activated chloride channel family protein